MIDKVKLEPYWNEDHTKYAILCGGSTGWVCTNVPELAWDSRVVRYVIEHLKIPEWKEAFNYFNSNKTHKDIYNSREYKEFDQFLTVLGYENSYLMGVGDIKVIWVPAGRKWKIVDGGECSDWLIFEDKVDWISFNKEQQ